MLCYSKCQAKSIKLFICFIFGATGQKAKEGGKAECAEKRFGKCVPNAGDCGDGFREATCSEHTTKHKCNIPCNWKKAFGGKRANVGDGCGPDIHIQYIHIFTYM